MVKDLIAIIGVLLIVAGTYFIYWPISLILVGLILTSYCILTTWQEQRVNNDIDR